MKFQLMQTSKTLEDCFALPHSVSIFIPSTVNANVLADSDFIADVVNFVAIELSNRFGGGNSEQKRAGFWMSDDLGLIIEDVIPVNASFDVRNGDNENFIIALAETVKEIMSQESVYFQIDGKAYLV